MKKFTIYLSVLIVILGFICMNITKTPKTTETEILEEKINPNLQKENITSQNIIKEISQQQQKLQLKEKTKSISDKVGKTRFTNVISRAVSNIKKAQIDKKKWNITSFLGSNFMSLFYIVLKFLNEPLPKSFSPEKLRQMHLKNQLPDGSWQQVIELNKNYGEIDTTIANYWFLKVYGKDDYNSPVMKKAREWIIKKGGVKKSMMMTKCYLALTGTISWDQFMWKIPLHIFNRNSILFGKLVNVRNMVAQWVFPHMIPICYLRHFTIRKSLGKEFNVDELIINKKKFYQPKTFPKPENYNSKWSSNEMETIKYILDIQEPAGSFGTYTVSSLFCIMALKDALKRWPNHKFAKRSEIAIKKGLEFVKTYYLKPFPGNNPYMGVLDDGHFWDTMLISNSLLELDQKKYQNYLSNAAEYMNENITPENGAIGFGIDFWNYVDVDDTSMLVLMLDRINKKKYHKQVQRAKNWLIKVQSPSGGWAAFNNDREGNFIIHFFAKTFVDSAELYDPACADLTGHILEALGHLGLSTKDKCVKKAVKYLKSVQDKDYGSFEGRWGINHIYGTGAALPGLSAVGVDFHEKWIQRAVDFLVTTQNTDGGWGEASMSYVNRLWIGRGVSTPTQTAWALFGLIEAHKNGLEVQDSIIKGVKYLLKDFEKKGEFWDDTCVGTGHRKLLYMQYPSYAVAFPLIALARISKLKFH